jgi:hypothetical protein
MGFGVARVRTAKGADQIRDVARQLNAAQTPLKQ